MTTLAPERSAVDRFTAPLYSVAEAARYLRLHDGTLRSWARGYTTHVNGRTVHGKRIITDLGRPGQRGPAIPFVGLAEAYALAAIRSAGVPLQRIRPALDRLKDDIGIGHALASKRMYTDGAEVLYDYATTADAEQAQALDELTVVRDGQRVFADAVRDYLRRVTWGPDDYAIAIPLPGYQQSEVVADSRRGFGQPTFKRGGARLEDVLQLFYAGEPAEVVAEEFGLTQRDVEDALRVDGKR